MLFLATTQLVWEVGGYGLYTLSPGPSMPSPTGTRPRQRPEHWILTRAPWLAGSVQDMGGQGKVHQLPGLRILVSTSDCYEAETIDISRRCEAGLFCLSHVAR